MKFNKKIKIVIAVDGGAGSGKTTGSKLIAKKFGLKLLTSGLLYRYCAYKLLTNNKIKNKKLFLRKIARKISENTAPKRPPKLLTTFASPVDNQSGSSTE